MINESSMHYKIIGVILLMSVIAIASFLLTYYDLNRIGTFPATSKTAAHISQENPEGKAGNTYDLSELAVCSSISDYVYDSQGRLIHCYDYRRRECNYYDYQREEINFSDWVLGYDTVLTYDERDRLINEKMFHISQDTDSLAKESIYVYGQDGCYTETKKYYLWNNEDEVTIYNSHDQIVQEGENILYSYDSQGRLLDITNSHESEKVADIQWNQESFQSIETMSIGNGQYVLWIDQYDERWQQISGKWYTGALDNPGSSSQEAESLCQPYYYADYYQDQLIEEMTNGRTKDVNGYDSSCYCFYDYDEKGRKIWYVWTNPRDDRIHAYQYLYDEQGQMTRELYYSIRGEWEQTLTDGSTIVFHRDEDEYLTDITRTGADGGLLHCFVFDDKHNLDYQTDENGDIAVYWKLNGKELMAIQEETSYYVQAGDSLWKIAQQFCKNGNLWPLLYEENKELIGDNPDLLFEGMELKISSKCQVHN